MSKRREAKEERKEVTLERRIEALEKQIAKMKPETYNFLTAYINKQAQQFQQVNRIAMEMQDFLQETGQIDKYKQWLEAKYPQPEDEKCPQCGGRGYVGDNEECSLCHPNKNQPGNEGDQ